MDNPRSHAAIPLSEADFLDFIYNYFKAEYAPIRSFWSTATADPRQPSRWVSMGHEMSPRITRPATAQAQKDIETVDHFTRKWNLDANFVRGLVIRFAKYEVHDRLEKKLYECARLDLMVRKALKEKHLLDALWPSPAPRNLPHELLAQGVQVRKWYGDMFIKYFRVLHSMDEFELRPEVDLRIRSSGKLMLVPFVDHLIFGHVDPIMPIVAMGAGYSNANGWRASGSSTSKSDGYGEPGRFEIRFDAPTDAQDTYTKTAVRQSQCNKCGTKRDVQVIISVDPNAAGAGTHTSSTRNASGLDPPEQQRNIPKAAHRYAPGYKMPGNHNNPPQQPPRPQPEQPARPSTPDTKKPCPRCTFLNHADLPSCEICQAPLSTTTTPNPPNTSHQTSTPPSTSPGPKHPTPKRPTAPKHHSLSSTLFSIFPFTLQQQQQQDEEDSRAHVQGTNPIIPSPESVSNTQSNPDPQKRVQTQNPTLNTHHDPSSPSPSPSPSPPPPPSSTQHSPKMTMMPLSPPDSTLHHQAPAGLPSHLMDDFVPVPVVAVSQGYEDEMEGWGDVRRDEGDEGVGVGVGLVDLDAVAREEVDVWGEGGGE